MSSFVTFKCDGYWFEWRCRGSISLPGMDADMLWPDAKAQGWSDNQDDDTEFEFREYCPAHTRHRAKAKAEAGS
jgi:hypothetical protein